MAKFGDLMTCVSKDIFKNTPSHVLVLIMTSHIWSNMGWFKIQKLEYYENGTKHFSEIKKILSLYLKRHIL